MSPDVLFKSKTDQVGAFDYSISSTYQNKMEDGDRNVWASDPFVY